MAQQGDVFFDALKGRLGVQRSVSNCLSGDLLAVSKCHADQENHNPEPVANRVDTKFERSVDCWHSFVGG